MNAVLLLSGDSAAGFAMNLDAATTAAGASAAAADIMNASVSRQFETIKNRLLVTLTELGTKALPFISEGLAFVSERMDSWGNAIGDVTKVLFDILKKSQIGETIAFIVDNIEDVQRVFQGLIDFVGGVFKGDWDRAWTGIKNSFGGVWNLMVEITEGAANAIVKGMNKIIEGWNAAIGFLKNGVKVFGETIIPGLDLTIGKIGEVNLEFIKFAGTVDAAGPGVKAFRGLMDGLGTAVQTTNDFIDPMSQFIDEVGAAAEETAGSIGGGGGFTAAINELSAAQQFNQQVTDDLTAFWADYTRGAQDAAVATFAITGEVLDLTAALDASRLAAISRSNSNLVNAANSAERSGGTLLSAQAFQLSTGENSSLSTSFNVIQREGESVADALARTTETFIQRLELTGASGDTINEALATVNAGTGATTINVNIDGNVTTTQESFEEAVVGAIQDAQEVGAL